MGDFKDYQQLLPIQVIKIHIKSTNYNNLTPERPSIEILIKKHFL